jgi:hypothetical protein
MAGVSGTLNFENEMMIVLDTLTLMAKSDEPFTASTDSRSTRARPPAL